MKKPDAVLRELGELYDFHRELRRFRFRQGREPDQVAAPDRGTAPQRPRSPVPDR